MKARLWRLSISQTEGHVFRQTCSVAPSLESKDMVMTSEAPCKRSFAEDPSLIQHYQQNWGLRVSSHFWSVAIIAMAAFT